MGMGNKKKTGMENLENESDLGKVGSATEEDEAENIYVSARR